MTINANKYDSIREADKSFDILFSRCDGHTYNQERKGLSYSFFRTIIMFSAPSALLTYIVCIHPYIGLEKPYDFTVNLICFLVPTMLSLVTLFFTFKMQNTFIPSSELPDYIKNIHEKNQLQAMPEYIKLYNVFFLFNHYARKIS